MKNSIEIFFDDTEILDLNPEFFVSWLSEVCSREKCTLGRLNLVFCSDEKLLEINKEFLNHDYYTDIITFGNIEDDYVGGELYLSVDRVRENANDLNIEFTHELYRVVVHGVLHLCGYKDKEDEELRVMRGKESEYLKMVSRET